MWKAVIASTASCCGWRGEATRRRVDCTTASVQRMQQKITYPYPSGSGASLRSLTRKFDSCRVHHRIRSRSLADSGTGLRNQLRRFDSCSGIHCGGLAEMDDCTSPLRKHALKSTAGSDPAASAISGRVDELLKSPVPKTGVPIGRWHRGLNSLLFRHVL